MTTFPGIFNAYFEIFDWILLIWSENENTCLSPRPGLSRQGSLERSRQNSTSEPPQATSHQPTPPMLQPPTSNLQPPHGSSTSPPAPTAKEEKKEQQSKTSTKEKKQEAAAQKKSSLLGSLMPGLPSWLKPKNQVSDNLLEDYQKPLIESVFLSHRNNTYALPISDPPSRRHEAFNSVQ